MRLIYLLCLAISPLFLTADTIIVKTKAPQNRNAVFQDKILFAKTKEFNCDSYRLEFIALCSDCQIKIKQSIPKDKLPSISLI